MKERSHIFVIIPAFNEARALRSTLEPLIARGYSVVVVDDGSTDGTWSVLAGMPVHTVRHPINLGQGAALQTGTDYARRYGAEVVVHFDADGQHSVEDIAVLVEPILAGQADAVLGSRFLRPSDARLVPPLKRALLRLGIVVSGALTGLWLTDTHNGFRALSGPAAERIRLQENGFAHATEILGQIRRARLRWVERPTTIHYSEYSRGKGQPAMNSLGILIDLLVRRLFR